MDIIPKAPYLLIPPEALQMVRKDINMDKPGEMKEAVRILDEWIKQEPYFLEKYIPLHYLEMTIVTSKGSLERAKRLIRNICTERTLRPERFEPRDLREYYEVFKNNYTVIAMPKLTPEYYRVLMWKITGKVNNTVLDNIYKYLYSCVDYLKVNDYHSGLCVVYDMTDTHMQYFLTHVNFFELLNCCNVLLNCYGLRLKRVHVITPSKAIHAILSIFKTCVSKKIMDRVVVNETAEELLQCYPKDVLPKDYGGHGKSMQELQEEILKALSNADHMQHVETMNKVKINKSVCSTHNINESGIEGSFRSLNLD